MVVTPSADVWAIGAIECLASEEGCAGLVLSNIDGVAGRGDAAR